MQDIILAYQIEQTARRKHVTFARNGTIDDMCKKVVYFYEAMSCLDGTYNNTLKRQFDRLQREKNTDRITRVITPLRN